MAADETVSTEELGRRTDRLEVKKQYDLDAEDYHELFYNSHECFMAHVSKQGYPMVSPMWYVVIDDVVHLSTIKDLRAKTAALIRNPKMSVIMTNFSVRAEDVKRVLNDANITTQVIGRYLVPISRIDSIMAILIKARAEVSDDRELRAQVSRMIVDKYYRDQPLEKKDELVTAIDTPNRVVIKVIPEQIWNWDLGKMFRS